MKKRSKIILCFACILLTLVLLCGCNEGPKQKSYMYGIISFSETGEQKECFVYVPADYCGEVKLYLEIDKIVYPEGMKSGDLVKLTFTGNVQILQGKNSQFFHPAPESIEVMGSGLKIEESGESYKLYFPPEKVEGLTKSSTIINLYKGESIIYSINDYVYVGDKLLVVINKADIFTVLQNYNERFVAR